MKMKMKLVEVFKKAIANQDKDLLQQAFELKKGLEEGTTKPVLSDSEIYDLFEDFRYNIKWQYERLLDDKDDEVSVLTDINFVDKGRYTELSFQIGVNFGAVVEPYGYDDFRAVEGKLERIGNILKYIPNAIAFLKPTQKEEVFDIDIESEYFGQVYVRNLYTVKL